MYTTEDYSQALHALLPSGVIWQTHTHSHLTTLLNACAETFARVDQAADTLSTEVLPDHTQSLLTDWERVTGFPDGCSDTLHTAEQRRQAVVNRLTQLASQSIAFFRQFAEILGFHITIDEFKPCRAGLSSVGNGLNNPKGWRYIWRVTLPEMTLHRLKAGSAHCAEPLRSWGHQSVICFLERLKPAHTRIIFEYHDSSVATQST